MALLELVPGDNNLPGWVLAGLLASAFLLLRRMSTSGPRISQYPLFGKEYGNRSKRVEAFLTRPFEVYTEGYRQFRDQVYRLTVPDGDHLIVPIHHLNELRHKTDDELDLLQAFKNSFADDHIKNFPPKDKTEIANSVVRVELTRNLVKLNPRLSAEVKRTVNEALPESRDWTPLEIVPILHHIIAVVSGNLFLGEEHARHPIYLNAAIEYTVDSAAAINEINAFPYWLRSIAVRLGFAPALKGVYHHRSELRKLLEPLVKERRQLKKEGLPGREDVLQWMVDKMDGAAASGEMDMDSMVQGQLLLTVAAIHTTSLSLTAMLYDLASRPELVEDLRKEIASVLAETDGVMTSKALFNLKLVDSFMRESQRFTPPFTDSFRRYALKPITLQDGTHIPAGTALETPSLAVLHDEQYYPNAATFDPYRFYRLRTDKTVPDPNGFPTRESYQFVSVTKENTTFGFGRHACPGRFFAANEIKLILARILLQYDMRFPEGVQGYPKFFQGSNCAPNPTGVIELRKVQ